MARLRFRQRGERGVVPRRVDGNFAHAVGASAATERGLVGNGGRVGAEAGEAVLEHGDLVVRGWQLGRERASPGGRAERAVLGRRQKRTPLATGRYDDMLAEQRVPAQLDLAVAAHLLLNLEDRGRGVVERVVVEVAAVGAVDAGSLHAGSLAGGRC